MQSEHQRGRWGMAARAGFNVLVAAAHIFWCTLTSTLGSLKAYGLGLLNTSSPSKELLEVMDRDFVQTFDEEFRKTWEEQQ